MFLGRTQTLPGVDLNHEPRLQRPVCYRYTTGQTNSVCTTGRRHSCIGWRLRFLPGGFRRVFVRLKDASLQVFAEFR